jgi:NAD(P)-dependent dehydrogenase (short-subunit alcohol dehydrogenase family)
MTRKIALVTGANGGLGTHVTKALLDAGFTVAGLSPKIQQSDFNHPDFIALPATLNSLDEAKKAVTSVIARCGKIDVLAHLVGGFAGGQTVTDTDDATWQRMLHMNLNSAFHILPGTMDTPANRKDIPGADVSQWVQPASVASLIVWLAGEAGKDVTGAAIPILGRAL